MDIGLSPVADWSNFLKCGQTEARRRQALPGAEVHDPNHCMSALDMAGAGMAGIQRRPTDQWPGKPVTKDDMEQCPNCHSSAVEEAWNGLNAFVPPWPVDVNGVEIPVYGKRPASFFRGHDAVNYYTLMLWTCGVCSKFWYHYLYHQSTCDGRATQEPAAATNLSTPEQVGTQNFGPFWSPDATLVDSMSPGFQVVPPILGGEQSFDLFKNSDTGVVPATASGSSIANRTVSDPRAGPPAPLAPHRLSFTTPVNVDAPTTRGRSVPPIDTNTPPWSAHAARSMGATPSPGGLLPSPFARSPFDTQSPGLSPSPVPYTPSQAQSGATPSGETDPRQDRLRQQSTPPVSLPARERRTHRDPDTYNQMRHMLACDKCRRRKKRCHPSHTGPRRKWKYRAQAGGASRDNSANSTGESPVLSPNLLQGDTWNTFGPGFGVQYGGEANRRSPGAGGVSQSPEAIVMFAPPRNEVASYSD